MKILHPCFNKDALSFGRIHLPVAPKCNIRCNYCNNHRSRDKPKIGACKRVITPDEAIKVTSRLIAKYNNIKVVGIAGPGDPLFNDETFITFKSIQENVIKCLCTNGLLLPHKVNLLNKLGIRYITVTINAVDPKVGSKIYSFVNYNGKRLKGNDAAEVLIQNQLDGLRLASKRMVVKVNSVLIPGINEKHIVDVAREIEDYAYIQNIIPLIPNYKFSSITQPHPKLVEKIRSKCEKFVRQMTHCAQCRADAAGRLHENTTIFTA